MGPPNIAQPPGNQPIDTFTRHNEPVVTKVVGWAQRQKKFDYFDEKDKMVLGLTVIPDPTASTHQFAKKSFQKPPSHCRNMVDTTLAVVLLTTALSVVSIIGLLGVSWLGALLLG